MEAKEALDRDFATRLAEGFGMLAEACPDDHGRDDWDGPLETPDGQKQEKPRKYAGIARNP